MISVSQMIEMGFGLKQTLKMGAFWDIAPCSLDAIFQKAVRTWNLTNYTLYSAEGVRDVCSIFFLF
jgi:hypothetical protein